MKSFDFFVSKHYEFQDDEYEERGSSNPFCEKVFSVVSKNWYIVYFLVCNLIFF